jgi:hypothetical protein
MQMMLISLSMEERKDARLRIVDDERRRYSRSEENTQTQLEGEKCEFHLLRSIRAHKSSISTFSTT